MRHTFLTVFLAVLMGAFVLAGCGPFTGDPVGQPEAQDYDQTCEQDADCALVFLSRACLCKERVAVNVSEREAVEEDNARETRFEGRCRTVADCAPPPEAQVTTCEMNVCVLKEIAQPE